ncbi:unnamed protein product [Closterium sp. Naga37s-1]|nr:unnamed protein product [Closterium sp. Naga37s-1]
MKSRHDGFKSLSPVLPYAVILGHTQLICVTWHLAVQARPLHWARPISHGSDDCSGHAAARPARWLCYRRCHRIHQHHATCNVALLFHMSTNPYPPQPAHPVRVSHIASNLYFQGCVPRLSTCTFLCRVLQQSRDTDSQQVNHPPMLLSFSLNHANVTATSQNATTLPSTQIKAVSSAPEHGHARNAPLYSIHTLSTLSHSSLPSLLLRAFLFRLSSSSSLPTPFTTHPAFPPSPSPCCSHVGSSFCCAVLFEMRMRALSVQLEDTRMELAATKGELEEAERRRGVEIREMRGKVEERERELVAVKGELAALKISGRLEYRLEDLEHLNGAKIFRPTMYPDDKSQRMRKCREWLGQLDKMFRHALPGVQFKEREGAGTVPAHHGKQPWGVELLQIADPDAAVNGL